MRENITLEEAYDQIKDIAWLWTIRHWGETKDASREPLVRIPKLVQHDVRLQDTDNKATAMDGWIEDTKGDKWTAIQTSLNEWRLVCCTRDLPDNDISSDDSESMDAAVPYGQSWERNSFGSPPVFRWVSPVFVLQL